jgi:D-methionine transport system ATP-binding protein
LCDEATSALDPQTTKSILELLKDINEKLQLTIVIITHEMQVIKEICDRVAVIEGGRIIEEGTVLDVFMEPKQATTREFISTIISRELPKAYRDIQFYDEYKPDRRLVLRLCFLGKTADNPVICEMVRHTSVIARIMYGNIDHIKNTTYGRLMVEINGTEEEINESMEFLKQQDLRIEVLGYVAGHDIDAD